MDARESARFLPPHVQEVQSATHELQPTSGEVPQGNDCPAAPRLGSTQWTRCKGVRMIDSRALAPRRAATSSHPALRPSDRFSSSLVGWLIQTAVISVVEGTCETFTGARGFSEEPLAASRAAVRASRFSLPVKFYQNTLISHAGDQESNSRIAGYVAGLRRWRRTVRS